jgi:hypothetical protein
MTKKGRLRKQSNPTNYISSGNWCGPGHTAGKRLDAKDMTFKDSLVSAVSPGDQGCKEHDIDTRFADTPQKRKAADEKFVKKMRKVGGFKENVMALLVDNFGPSSKDPFLTPPKKKHKRLHYSISPQTEMTIDERNIIPVRTPPKKRPASEPETPNKKPKSDDNAGHSTDVETAPTPRMAAGAPTTGRGHGNETGVEMIKEQKLKPFHATQDAILPYYYNGTLALAASTTVTGQASFSVRLNAISDVLTTRTFTSDPGAAADAVDANLNKPMLYEYWKSIYNYYNVTSSQYRIRMYSLTSDFSWVGSVWLYHHGLQHPPFVDGALNYVKDHIRKLHPHTKHQYLVPGVGQTHFTDQAITFNGYFDPENFPHEVVEDQYINTWTKFDAVPPQFEYMTLIINKADMPPADMIQSIRLEIEVIYHVQFKDLKRMHQYPLNTDDMSAITDPYAIVSGTF